MCKSIYAPLMTVLLVASVCGQPPDKPAVRPEITPEDLRRSSLASDAPEDGALQFYFHAGERAYPAFQAILSDPKSDPRLVSQILVILAVQDKADRSRFLPLLRKRLTDPESYVRYEAVAAVGQVGNKDDLPALAVFLASEDKWTVKMGASAVAKIGGENALTVLDIWLLSGHYRDDPDVRGVVTKCRDELKQRLEKAKKPGK